MLAAVFLVTALAVLSVSASTAIYRYRVERLYARALQLRVGASSLTEVQQLAKDYRRNVTFESASCSWDGCDFTIRLYHTTLPMLYFDPQTSHVGSRPVVTVLTVRARDGKLTYASFGMSGRAPTGREITAAFHAARELTTFDKCSNPSLGRDSAYTVKAIAHRGIIETAFGSHANEVIRAAATNVQIGCFTTAVRDCNEITTLMPSAFEFNPHSVNCDDSFERECRQYVDKLEAHQGPWKVDSAFYDTPVTLEIWILVRCPSSPFRPQLP
jgi:hypothetical protein